MATEKVDILTINTEPSKTSVKDLRKEMKSLKDEMLNLEEGTVEYNAALQKAAGIQHTLKEQMEEVNASAMDAGQILGNTSNAVAGMTGAFQASAGVMNMFGVESEASMEMIAKMQNVMAITQGFQAIDDGAKAFKRLGNAIKASALFNKLFIKTTVESTAATTANAAAQIVGSKATDVGTKSVWKFNTALLANPIMWVVAGIVAAVAAIGALIVATNKVEYAQADFNAELEKTKRLQEDLEISQSEEIQLMQARGATEREIMDQRIKDANTNLNNANALVDELMAIEGTRNEEQQKVYDEALANQKKYAAEFRQVGVDSAELDIRTAVNAEKEKAAKIKEANDKALAEKQKQIEDDKALIKATEEELKNKRQTDLQNALDDENEKYEKQKAAYIRQNKDIKELTLQHEKDIQKIKDDAAKEDKAKSEANAKEKSDIIIKGYEERKVKLTDAEQQELNIMTRKLADGKISQEEFDEWKSTADDLRIQNEITSLNNLLNNTALTEEAKAEIQRQITGLEMEQSEKRIEANKTETEKKKEETDKQIALEQYKTDAMFKMAGSLSSVLNSAADMADENSKEQKALKISSTIIDTIAGAVGAFMGITKDTGGWGIALATATAAGVLASGMASVKKMIATPVGKNGGGGGGASIPSISLAGLAASQAPVQQTTQVTGASTEDAIKDNRVYVVEADITNTQRKVGTAEAEATF